jgi:hypothetical protein
MPDFEVIASQFVSRRIATGSAFCGPVLQNHTADQLGKSPGIPGIFEPRLTRNLETSYIFRYPELKNESDESSWAIRQIGVYQQYSKSTKNSVWVFLHCQQGSRGQKLITELLEKASGAKSAYKHPAVVHLLLLSCYLYNWQKYMAFYEKELLTRVCTLFQATIRNSLSL